MPPAIAFIQDISFLDYISPNCCSFQTTLVSPFPNPFSILHLFYRIQCPTGCPPSQQLTCFSNYRGCPHDILTLRKNLFLVFCWRYSKQAPARSFGWLPRTQRYRMQSCVNYNHNCILPYTEIVWEMNDRLIQWIPFKRRWCSLFQNVSNWCE